MDMFAYIDAENTVECYIGEERCDHEGYVLHNKYGTFKIVNREGFSRANFNLVREWDWYTKGEPLNCSSSEGRKTFKVTDTTPENVFKSNLSSPSLIFYTDLIMQTQKIRNLRITEEQESVLVEMISFFNDNGWINEESSADYDSLAETICDPGFWEYE